MNIVIFRHMTDTWLAIYKISVYTLTMHTMYVRYKRPKKCCGVAREYCDISLYDGHVVSNI